MSELQNLNTPHDAILLAEAIGWLHDYRKCSEEQLQTHSANTTAQGIARNELTNRFNSLTTAALTLSSVTEQLPDLLNNWEKQANKAHASFLLQYLSRCHNTAHFDKQEPLDSGKQNYPGTQISTAFGFETAVGPHLTNQLWTLPWNSLTTYRAHDRNALLSATQSLFSTVGADTRRPMNEISLWDWGLLVGALYKTALAAVALGQQPATRDLRWRLLGVRTDALTYFASASRLSDLMARQNTLQIAINKVQTLLEIVYPLATEVYRDENGSLYVVADLANLLGLQDGSDRTLLSHLQEQFATDGEIVPQITLDPIAWWGQDPGFERKNPDADYKHEIPPAGAMLLSPTILQSDAAVIREAWQDKQQTVCPICGLRPCVNRQLDYCQICGDRRRGRVTDWLQDQNKTIWLDEVADRNGRLALITGTFDLTNWLDGSLVETLLVQEPTTSNLPVAKTPSFARLRRIWQTTQIFWQGAQTNASQTLSDARRRLQLTLANTPGLTAHQTYELDLLGQTRMSVLWDGIYLLSIDNLSYIASQLGFPLKDSETEEIRTPEDLALNVGTWLEQNKESKLGQKQVFQLISDDEKNRRFDIQIADIGYQDTAYATIIPILVQPRTFMALVPANRALDIVNAIKTKYEREMGKVRNRLPLHLGVVYFQRRTPLRAALDAGRRMLRQKPLGGDQLWCVKRVTRPAKSDLPLRLADGTQHFEQTIRLELTQGERAITWHVPAVMGDGVTNDNWYPYVFVPSDVSGRELVFKGRRPKPDGTTETCWLIHAGQLEAGDKVYFTPATFDFQWLDSSSRRFEIAYDAQTGQRRNHPIRPYLLDDLATMQQVWSLIVGKNGLASSQIYALRDLVEAKREAWGAGETFSQLCCDAVRNAQWKNRQEVDFNLLIQAARSGLLTDVIQLYMGIMKEKPKWEEENHE